MQDGCSRLKRDAKEEFLAAADPPQNAAGAVGFGVDPAVGHGEGIVVLGTPQEAAAEAAANLEALGGGEGEHRLGQIGLQAVEDRLAQPDREVADATFDDSAY